MTIEKAKKLVRKYQKTNKKDFAIIKKDCGDIDFCSLKTAKINNYLILEIVEFT